MPDIHEITNASHNPSLAEQLDDKKGIYFYMLINTEKGTAMPAFDQISQMDSLVEISVALGRVDLICLLRTDTTIEMSDVMKNIHSIPGIKETHTTVVIGRPMFPEANNPDPLNQP